MPDQNLLVLSYEDLARLVKVSERALRSKDLKEVAQEMLPVLVRMMEGAAAVLCLEGHPPTSYSFCLPEVQRKTVHVFKGVCAEHFQQIPCVKDAQPWIFSLAPPETARVALYGLHHKERRIGALGVLIPETSNLILGEPLICLFSQALVQFIERLAYEKEIARLKAYYSVCSKIAQAVNLRDVLEAVLHSSMEAVSAEAASVLLLDDEQQNFRFFGLVPPQPVMMDAEFSVTLGLAGYVFRSQQSEIINDVQRDPRFYKRFDLETGFHSRNMVAIPLMAGVEKIGVLEVLNKTGGEPFQEEDRLLLESIAEEIAFAIHDAKLFDAKQALKAKIDKMQQFQAKLIQISNDGIIANDQHGNLLVFNEGAERILGYTKEEVMNRLRVQALYPQGIAQEVMEKINSQDYGGRGRLIQYETTAVRKDGEHIPIELSASLIYEEDQELAIVGFFRDLRERKQLEEKILQAERLAALGHMAAHISHEVKNPLVVIGGLARQVKKSLADGSPKDLEKLQIIVDEIQLLEEFLAEVGSFAKLTEPKDCLIDLNSIIREICLRLQPTLEEKGIELSLHLDPDLQLLRLDPVHLRQVILNIAKNGLEAMSNGGTLTFRTAQDQDQIIMQVSDTGEGIPAEVIDKIFQPFYSTKPRGSGLGLAICQTILKTHQGDIRIESTPQKGTRVTVYLKGAPPCL